MTLNLTHALNRILKAFAEDTHLAVSLPKVLHLVCEEVDAVGARIVIANGEGASFGGGSIADRMAGEDSALWAYISQPVIIPDINDAPMNLSEALSDTVRSLVTLPLEANRERQGILWLAFDHPYNLSEEQYDFLSMVATQIAVVLANQPATGITFSGMELAQIMANSPDALVILDNDGAILLANNAAQDLFQLNGNVQGQTFLQEVQDETLHNILQGKTPVTPHTEFVSHDGRVFKPTISPIMSAYGLQIGTLMFLWEISRYKRITENLSTFLNTVSHDLRSPLTAVKGFADMLGMVGEVNDKQKEMIRKILTGITDMSDLVEKVLDAGRVDPEVGTYQIRREITDPTSIIRKVVSWQTGAASEKGIHITTDIAPNLPIVNLDTLMIERALGNLVQNAIKYIQDGGEVRVGGKIEGDNLIFFVKDNGPGIPTGDRERLFLKGERLHRKEQKRQRGIGLGLFIVKNIAQQHHGDAYVESEEGQGSNFIIKLPLSGENLPGGTAN